MTVLAARPFPCPPIALTPALRADLEMLAANHGVAITGIITKADGGVRFDLEGDLVDAGRFGQAASALLRGCADAAGGRPLSVRGITCSERIGHHLARPRA